MSDDTLLNVENMTVRFAVKRGRGFGKNAFLHAVDDVSFSVKRGETLAIVGESGSGKTTTALAVARLVDSYKGKVNLGDTDLLALGDEDLRQARARVQFIFQDPYSSLNPRLRAADIVREPMDSLGEMSEAENPSALISCLMPLVCDLSNNACSRISSLVGNVNVSASRARLRRSLI